MFTEISICLKTINTFGTKSISLRMAVPELKPFLEIPR